MVIRINLLSNFTGASMFGNIRHLKPKAFRLFVILAPRPIPCWFDTKVTVTLVVPSVKLGMERLIVNQPLNCPGANFEGFSNLVSVPCKMGECKRREFYLLLFLGLGNSAQLSLLPLCGGGATGYESIQ